MRVLLASKSPRRSALFGAFFTEDFDVADTHADESYVGATPAETVAQIAKTKLAAAPNASGYGLVLAADTLVYRGGKYYGKPKDNQDAAAMLKELSGRTHTVVSGVAVRYAGRVYTLTDENQVTFRKLSGAEIQNYVDGYPLLDKAGAYAIQDGVMVASFTGDYTNIMGLPVSALKRLFLQEGIPL